ncbi:MAG TPA: acetyl-CoA carboxylase biotin carboxyl carrier protein [Geobacteraceae bacterium]|nr:acetyl-CoA carboxylase biotin carboxyl carrier protein [Geobacteraceae bacterium]
MELKDIRTLIKMVIETDITEFELESSEDKIRIKRGGSQQVSYYTPTQPVAVPLQAAQPQIAAPQAEEIQPVSGEPENVPEKGKAVTSPIVGTMYRAPAPEEPPFVEVGQVVEKGQVLCIVEAMKLMNEIEAEYRCRILSICKDNAQPVEFGDTLFIVEPL